MAKALPKKKKAPSPDAKKRSAVVGSPKKAVKVSIAIQFSDGPYRIDPNDAIRMKLVSFERLHDEVSNLQQRANAKRPRKADVTLERVLNCRKEFILKHGRERGWKTAAALELKISPATLRKRMRK